MPGTILAIGEAPFALGPELLRSKGAFADADRLERIRSALRERGTRIGAIGGSIGIWRIDTAAVGPRSPSPEGTSSSSVPTEPRARVTRRWLTGVRS